jgi:hypothetical protein
MTLRDVLKDAIDFAGVPISDADFIRNYNRCMYELAMNYDTAKKRVTQTIICTDAADQYALTAGCLRIERVLDSNESPFKSYSIYGNAYIVFAYTGTYTVDGTFEQTPITLMSGTIAINTAYLRPIAEYIAAKALKKSDTDKSKELMEYFMRDSAMANKNIRKATNPNKKVYVPPFR